MTTLPLATRLARRLSRLVRPAERRRAEASPKFDERTLRDAGLSGLEIEVMRRLW